MFDAPGQTRVYASVNGIESPRLEIFRDDRLADEMRPSLLAYGRDVPVAIAPSEGGGILGYQIETGFWQRPGLMPTFLYCNKACGEAHRRSGARGSEGPK